MTHRKIKLGFSVFSILGWVFAYPAFAQPPAEPSAAVAIPHMRYVLPNGLEVILAPNKRLPRVTVNMRYKVGSANDAQGRAGSAHVFEHLYTFSDLAVMKVRLSDVGATQVGATTEFDRTTYYSTIPTSELETALAIEAERMATIGALINPNLLAREIMAVRNERRLVVENRPYSLADEAIFAHLFPKGHPYHHLYIGNHRDIQAITLEEARAFFAQYYTPNNAVLTIAGDFNDSDARKLVDTYFGPIQRGNAVEGSGMALSAISDSRQTVADQIERPRLSLAWRSPANYTSLSAETDLLSVVLGHGGESRLHRRLVIQDKLAQAVSVYNFPFRLNSAFVVHITPAKGADLADIENAVQDEVRSLSTKGVDDDELARARNTLTLRILRGLERNGDITDRSGLTIDPPYGGISEQLSECAHLTADTNCVSARVAAYRNATPATILEAAAALFGSAKITLVAQPGERVLDDPPAPADMNSHVADNATTAQSGTHRSKPKAKPARLVSDSLPVPRVFKLPNGLTIYHVRAANAATVTALLAVKGGTQASLQPGHAAFLKDMLVKGTQRRSASRIIHDGAQLGTTLEADIDRDAIALRISVQRSNFAEALDLLADVARNPAFAPDAIEAVRATRREQIAETGTVADTLASKALTQALYGKEQPMGSGGLFNDVAFARPHPYGYEDVGTLDSLEMIRQADLASLHRAIFTPRNSALVVYGDISDAALRQYAVHNFGDWRGKNSHRGQHKRALPAATRLVLEESGPSSQSILRWGAIAPGHNSPDALALRLTNIIFGEVYASRITANLRERNGYTYMARSRVVPGVTDGTFAFGTSVKAAATAAAVREITKELDLLGKELVASEELQFARTYFDNALLDQFETSAATVTSLADLFIYDLPPGYFTRLSKRAVRVSRDDVRKAARKYLAPSQMTLVAVGSGDHLKELKAPQSDEQPSATLK